MGAKKIEEGLESLKNHHHNTTKKEHIMTTTNNQNYNMYVRTSDWNYSWHCISWREVLDNRVWLKKHNIDVIRETVIPC